MVVLFSLFFFSFFYPLVMRSALETVRENNTLPCSSSLCADAGCEMGMNRTWLCIKF